jgi:hypothetical protein
VEVALPLLLLQLLQLVQLAVHGGQGSLGYVVHDSL